MAGVTGTLGLFSLVDLFQLLAAAARTGRLSVQHPAGQARMYFERGRVTHAEFAGLEGEAAVYALFEDERGPFEFVVGLPAPRLSVTTATENLVLEALRRLDEQHRDEPARGPEVSRDAVPFVPEDAVRDLPFGADERRVLEAVNGQRTVTRLAANLGLPLAEVQRVVGRLVGVGTLQLRARRPRTAQLVVRLARAGVPSGVVGLDEGIVHNWSRVLGADVPEVAVRRPDGTAFAAPLTTVVGGGPYLLVVPDTLLRLGLRVDDTVLVKPYET
jgi:hypothetical protein